MSGFFEQVIELIHNEDINRDHYGFQIEMLRIYIPCIPTITTREFIDVLDVLFNDLEKYIIIGDMTNISELYINNLINFGCRYIDFITTKLDSYWWLNKHFIDDEYIINSFHELGELRNNYCILLEYEPNHPESNNWEKNSKKIISNHIVNKYKNVFNRITNNKELKDLQLIQLVCE